MKLIVVVLLFASAAFAETSQTPAKVIFYQTSQLKQGGNGYRGGVHVSINIDGQRVHKLKNFKFWETELPAGQHFITADLPEWGKNYSLESGQTYYFRMETIGVPSWHSSLIKFRAVKVPSEVADGEITGLKQDSD